VTDTKQQQGQQQQQGQGLEARKHEGLEPGGAGGQHQVLVVAPAEDLGLPKKGTASGEQAGGNTGAPVKPAALAAPTLLQPIPDPEKKPPPPPPQQQQQPLGPLLASPHFWAPAVAGSIAFCNMAAVMVGGWVG
jgi:hypothetical protein